jgi:adenosylcobinamide-GDP ribazoletransferase
MVAVWAALPPARPDGMSSAAGRPGPAAATAALAVAAGLTITALAAAGAAAVAAGVAVAAVVAALLGLAAARTIGGQTGDILGAVAVTAEIGFLAGLIA